MRKKNDHNQDKVEEVFLDEEERILAQELEAGEWVPSGDFEKLRPEFIKMATNTIKKRQRSQTKSISLRIPQPDLTRLKIKADQLGMGYQTLIKSILHRYLRGELS